MNLFLAQSENLIFDAVLRGLGDHQVEHSAAFEGATLDRREPHDRVEVVGDVSYKRRIVRGTVLSAATRARVPGRSAVARGCVVVRAHLARVAADDEGYEQEPMNPHAFEYRRARKGAPATLKAWNARGSY